VKSRLSGFIMAVSLWAGGYPMTIGGLEPEVWEETGIRMVGVCFS